MLQASNNKSDHLHVDEISKLDLSSRKNQTQYHSQNLILKETMLYFKAIPGERT